MPRFIAAFLPNFILQFAQGLRFPQLFALFTCLFVFDLFVPDFIPLADELLLGVCALAFARLKRRQDPPSEVEHD